MANNEYTGGSVFYCIWVHSGGTVTLNTDYRSFSVSKSVETVDATAGADENRRYLQTFDVIGVDLEALAQSDGGTSTYSVLQQGTNGTLIWAPSGTVATRLKCTLPAFISQSNMAVPYADVVTLSLSFTANGAYVEANW